MLYVMLPQYVHPIVRDALNHSQQWSGPVRAGIPPLQLLQVEELYVIPYDRDMRRVFMCGRAHVHCVQSTLTLDTAVYIGFPWSSAADGDSSA